MAEELRVGLNELSLEDEYRMLEATKSIIHRCDVPCSPNDKRKYRLIRLQNGLRCLLVSNGYRNDIVRVLAIVIQRLLCMSHGECVQEVDDRPAAAALRVGVGLAILTAASLHTVLTP